MHSSRIRPVSRLLLRACSFSAICVLIACGGGAGGSTDTDGDGLSNADEITIYHTSPQLSDTDGDGFSDYKEVIDFGFDAANNNYKFNPLIADTPKISVTLTSDPDIDLIYTDTDGVTVTRGTTRQVTDTSTLTTTNASTTGTKVEDTHDAGGTVGVDGTGAPSAEVSYAYKNVTTRESSAGWTQSQIDEHSQVVTDSEIVENERVISTSGGSIAYSVTIQNEGDIAFTLTSLSLSVLGIFPDQDNRFTPVGNLDLDTSFSRFPATSLGPGGSAQDMVFANRNLDTGSVKDLLANSTGLVTEVAAYEVVDANGRAFVHDETAIAARTAMILIDYAPTSGRSAEQYAVATNVSGAGTGITVREAMADVLNIPYTTVGGTLTGVRNVTADAATNGLWLALHVYDSGPDRVVDQYDDVTSYDFDNLVLKAGQVLHLVHLNDADMDGLRDRQETIYRTDPQLADTDGDTLTDFSEVTAFSINIDGVAVDVRSDPTLADGDADGVSDLEERTPSVVGMQPSNPLMADTDGDGLDDGIDPFPATSDLYDMTGLTTVATPTGTPRIDLAWTRPQDLNNLTRQVLWLYYEQSEADIAAGVVVPDPDTTAVSGTLYNQNTAFGTNGWKVLSHKKVASETTAHTGIAATFSGQYKYIASLNIDTTGNGVGDIFVPSKLTDTVPLSVPTTTVSVTILGVDMEQCRDYLLPIAMNPFGAIRATLVTLHCDPYWNFASTPGANGGIPQTIQLPESAAASQFFPVRSAKTIMAYSSGNVIHMDVPAVSGQCATVIARLYDADDRVTTTTSGDEHARTLLRWCYNANLWDTPSGPFVGSRTATLSGGKFNRIFQSSSTRRTRMTVRYSVRFTPTPP